MQRLPSTIAFSKMLRLSYQFVNLALMYIFLLLTFLYKVFNIKKINAYPQPYASVYTQTSYQSPEMSTWQTFCTGKEVLRKLTLKLNSDKFKENHVFHFRL